MQNFIDHTEIRLAARNT